MIKKSINKIKFWYTNSRPYTVPITAMCWLVAFLYSASVGGNILYGIIAYIGIAVLHLATNLSDDYFDYKRLKDFTNNEKTIKCAYLRNGSATIEQLRNVIIIMILTAALVGVILFMLSGWKITLFALAALPIVLFYSKLSSKGLGDIAVIFAYGPLMFEGVCYVMTGRLSIDIFILSVACGLVVNSILYTHMLMDFDSDVNSNKITLCTRLKTKNNALIGLMFFYIFAFLFMYILFIRTANSLYILTFLIIPFIIDLYNSLKLYNIEPKSIPEKLPFGVPAKIIENSQNAPFFSRFIYSINISTIFMLLACLAIIGNYFLS